MSDLSRDEKKRMSWRNPFPPSLKDEGESVIKRDCARWFPSQSVSACVKQRPWGERALPVHRGEQSAPESGEVATESH